MKRDRNVGVLAFVVGALLLVAGWAVLAPPQVGGRTAYLSTVGISMQPKFHAGDLIVVRPASRYRVGEVAAYNSDTLHTKVLHRIVAEDDAGFVTKGDNNSFLDPDHPRADQFLGKQWVLVPRGGRTLGWLRQPAHTTFLVALVALLAGGTATAARRRTSRDRRRDQRPVSIPSAALPGIAGQVLAVAAVAGVVFAAVGGLAYTRPTTKPAKTTHTYSEQGRFDYTAAAPAGPVYDQGRLHTGDPIFLKLINKLDVTFDYHVVAPAAHDVSGTASMQAELAGSSGWRRTLALTPPTSFTGDHTTMTSTVDLASLRSLIDDVEKQTGGTGGSYTLTLAPEVRMAGTIAGTPVPDAAFTPRLAFRLDSQQLRVDGATGDAAAVDQKLDQTKQSKVEAPTSIPRRLSFAGHGIDVEHARLVSLVGVAVAFAVGMATLNASRRRSSDRRAAIDAKYHDVLIPVASLEVPPERHVVELASMEGLVRVAERYDRMVLVHRNADGGDAYIVEDDATLFRYRAAPDVD